MKSHQQNDSYNCGTFVCYNFTKLICDQLPVGIPMDAYRETIYSTIMNQTRLIKTKK
jgi:hypothetical protein